MRRYSALVPLLLLATLPPSSGCAAPGPEVDPDSVPSAESRPAQVQVVPGLEVLLRDSAHLVRGKRVGLITNQTAITRDKTSAIDLLHESDAVDLRALFGPEHGLRGGIEGGVKIEGGRDPVTGVLIHSLYGKTQRPTPEMLEDLDVLMFDMQDIGARPYTFVWTMAMAMEAAAEAGLPFLVLDRPNPITDRVEGPLMEMEMRNVGQPITGYYPVPLRHGMTVGEVARYINDRYDIGADLTVVPAAGWSGDVWFDETDLPWVNPSPNIRSLEAALHYSGLVLLEATNLSVGRGTPEPFTVIGAPWVDNAALAEALERYELPGVRIEPTTFVPTGSGWVPHRDETVRGLELTVTDRDAYLPVKTALAILTEVKRLHPTEFKISNEGFTQMLGSRWAREAFDRGAPVDEIWQRWERETAEWGRETARYRIY